MGDGADAVRLLDDAVALGQEARLGDELPPTARRARGGL